MRRRLVTLEGLPHDGRTALLERVQRLRPAWRVLSAPAHVPERDTVAAALDGFACFQSLLTKTISLAGVWANAASDAESELEAADPDADPGADPDADPNADPNADPDTVLLMEPWMECLPRHPRTLALFHDMARELVGTLGVRADEHVLLFVRVRHHDAFDHLMTAESSIWTRVSLDDARAQQTHVAHAMHTQRCSPFPCRAYTLHPPPRYGDNEVDIQSLAREVVDLVDSADLVIN